MPWVVNAFSVDLEEYHHATIFREATQALAGWSFDSRVEIGTNLILTLLTDHSVRGTFFVLGEVAAAQPGLIKRIAAEGHEVACHGYQHNLVSRLSPDEFRSDVRRAKAVLEDLISEPVLGYRAPSFSIPPGSVWTYEVLLELGFRYDSSIYPILHDRYGDPRAPRAPYSICGNGTDHLIEFPIGTVRVLGFNLPIGGGGYFRLFPQGIVRWGIQRVNRREGTPIVFYLHPWELDPALPRPPMTWSHRFRLYVGIDSMETRLAHLLKAVPFGPIRDILGLTQHGSSETLKKSQQERKDPA